MLSAKENMRRTIEIAKDPTGPKPDRFVNQYEALQLVINPFFMWSPSPQKGQMRVKNLWGVINSWPEHVPGAFPEHNNPEDILIKDIENWRDDVTIPDLKAMPNELWDICQGMMDAIDGEKSFKAVFVAPGLFEQTHHFCSMQEALVNYLEYEDEMHDLIKMLTEWELELADLICSKLHPDVMFHHDDLGTEKNSFMSPEIEEEFLMEPYKEIYGYWKERGTKYIIHHSDSYGATIVPDMIEMGVDVWQGVMSSNDIPELIKKYGDKITFMGGLDGADIEKADWTKPWVKEQVEKICRENGHHAFIPCITQGLPMSTYEGLYECIGECIDEMSVELADTFEGNEAYKG